MGILLIPSQSSKMSISTEASESALLKHNDQRPVSTGRSLLCPCSIAIFYQAKRNPYQFGQKKLRFVRCFQSLILQVYPYPFFAYTGIRILFGGINSRRILREVYLPAVYLLQIRAFLLFSFSRYPDASPQPFVFPRFGI